MADENGEMREALLAEYRKCFNQKDLLETGIEQRKGLNKFACTKYLNQLQKLFE